jgi:threonylcarbamoyladenosine tRNA methylthiotransferase MtaB
MASRHRRADALALIARLRAIRPGIAIGADLIAGFPTESAEAHAANLSLLADARLAHAHVFPFSPRPGTHAASLPPLPPATVRARAAELRAAATIHTHAFMAALIGTAQETVSEGMKGIGPHGFAVRYATRQPRGACVTLVPRAIAGDMLAP